MGKAIERELDVLGTACPQDHLNNDEATWIKGGPRGGFCSDALHMFDTSRMLSHLMSCSLTTTCPANGCTGKCGQPKQCGHGPSADVGGQSKGNTVRVGGRGVPQS